MMRKRVVSLVPDSMKDTVKKLVEDGYYPSQSEIIREGIRNIMGDCLIPEIYDYDVKRSCPNGCHDDFNIRRTMVFYHIFEGAKTYENIYLCHKCGKIVEA